MPGADVVTLGNHAFGKQQIVPYLDEHSDILRPANLAPQSRGRAGAFLTARRAAACSSST